MLVAWLLLVMAGHADAELSCVACHTGFFLDQQTLACRRCPANSSTWKYSNASAATDCVCDPGFSNASDTCRPCRLGFYKALLENSTCTACMLNAYTVSNASVSPADCLCNAGFSLQNHVQLDPAADICTVCVAGTFKDRLGDEPCQDCPSNYFCPAGSIDAQACPTNSVSAKNSGSVYDCECLPGYYHQYTHTSPPLLACVPCGPGTYSDTPNTTTCTLCPENSFFTRTGASSIDECETCPAHAISAAGSANETDCFCRLGYSGKPGHECAACAPGFFRDSTDSYICEACPSDTYNARVASFDEEDCQQCPAETTSVSGSVSKSDCLCRRGSFATISTDGVSWECTACEAGAYSSTINASACQSCPPGTASAVLSANSSTVCEPCDNGHYALQSATTACSSCPHGTWQNLTNPLRLSQSCQVCPGNSTHTGTASTDIHDCACRQGFVKVSSTDTPMLCAECRPGAYCPGNGLQIACPYNFWSPGGVFSGPCVECAPLSLALSNGSSTGRHQCQCVLGSEGAYDSTCALCVPGKFQPLDYTYPSGAEYQGGDAVATECLACPVGTYSDTAGASICLNCPLNSNSSAGSDAVTMCVCNPSYYGPAGGPCEECPPDSFCLGGVAATQCRSHSTSPALSAEAADCLCDEGYFSTPELLTCRRCPMGSYCHGDQHVAPCPHNSSSVAGSPGIDACSCVAGTWRGCIESSTGEYIDESGQSCEIDWSRSCVTCGGDNICINNTLLHCPTHSSAPRGSSDVHACVCGDGFYNVFHHDPSAHAHEVEYEHDASAGEMPIDNSH